MVQLYHNRNVNKNSLLFKVDYTTITSLCRWKPLRRFCSAVHNVDRACISVLSQVIRNVNEKKNRTDKYDFLREPWRWDSKNFVKLLLHKIFAQKSIGMPGEQEYHICLYDFSFSSTLIKTCGRTLISALHNPRKHHKICYSTVS